MPHRKVLQAPLSRKAILVSVRISQWSARKLDRKITDEVNQAHNATKDAGRYNKLLIAKEHLAELNSLVSFARGLHHNLTRPWADEGMRILPNVLYDKFAEEFRILKRDFDKAADKFARAYPSFVQERRLALNGLFNEADYPAADDIRSKFELTLKVMPFPDADDFRSTLDAETVADIKREIAATSKAVVDNAMQETVHEIAKTVGHMAAKLKEYKTEPGKFFLDSLVENVRDIAGLLPAFNLTDDPKITALAKRIEQELCAEDADTLRKNDDARAVVAKSADDILAEVGKLLG